MADDQNVQTQGGQVQDSQNQNAAATPAADPATSSSVQTDIANIEAAITNLESAGKALFADEITVLKQKRDALIAKAKAEAEAVTTEVITVEQSFVQKYGSGTAHFLEIAMLATILGKLLGVF